MRLADQLPCLGHVRNVLLIVAITALMAIATALIAYVFDLLPMTGKQAAAARMLATAIDFKAPS